jgi:parallel beta-helix repeat protein
MTSSWRERCAQYFRLARTTDGAALRRRTAVSLVLETLEDRTVPSTFVVTTNADSGAGSLRQAILNADTHPGNNRIVFNLSSGHNVINLQSALPSITRSVTIDGTTQPGYHGTPVVELNGAGAGAGANGLTITAGNVHVEGLAIDNFQGDGIRIQGSSATGDRVLGDQIFNNGMAGVHIVNAFGNVLGGNQAGQGNFIADNGGDGVSISGSGATGNRLVGNWIGALSNGAVLGNSGNGVNISAGASNNTVRDNTITGNGAYGVRVDGARQELILSNSIFANTSGAIGFFDGANNNQAAPTLTSLVVSGTHAKLQGNVGSANTSFLLQVFTDEPNGQVLVSSLSVRSDSSGNFTVHLSNIAATDVLTATVTVGGNTSSLANEITINGPVSPPASPPLAASSSREHAQGYASAWLSRGILRRAESIGERMLSGWPAAAGTVFLPWP